MSANNESIGTLAAAAFASVEQAESALQNLMNAGFTEDQISVIGSVDDEQHLLHEWLPQAQEAGGERSTTNVAIGGLLGGILGGAIAISAPGIGWALGAGVIATAVAGGGFGGGLLGPLVELEVDEGRALYLDERLKSGDIIVTVHADRQSGEAQEILQKFGGKTANTSMA